MKSRFLLWCFIYTLIDIADICLLKIFIFDDLILENITIWKRQNCKRILIIVSKSTSSNQFRQKKRCTTGELHIGPLLFILYYYDILEALFIPS